MTSKIKSFFLLPITLCLLVLLNGCVRYDVGVNIEGAHRGAIVQTIQLGEQLTSFSRSEAQNWLKSIEQRSRQLGGKTKRISDEEIVVTLPFANGDELQSKFNTFFHPDAQPKATSTQLDFVQFNSEMQLQQSNLLLFQRNYLHLSVDLRALGVLATQGKVVVDPSSLVNLAFRLNTPWGARGITQHANSVTPETFNGRHSLVWHLQPGQVNDIEAVFWLPSPLGWGTLAIALFIGIGYYLKYKRLPLSSDSILPTAS